MLTHPLVSIIIPHYNRTRLLKETIDSVKRQTYKFWEVLIIDDGSDELKKLSAFEEQNIKLLHRTELPKGPSHCRNIGIELARGQYILFLDSDDLLAPWCVENRMKAFHENSDCDLCVFPALNFFESPGDSNQLWNTMDTTKNPLEHFLAFDGPWCVSSSFWKKEVLVKLGGFNTEIFYGDDAELHIRALLEQCTFKEFARSIPDCFIRRGNELRVTNMCSEAIVNSKTTYLNKISELLYLYKTDKRLTDKLTTNYFTEAEWCMFKRLFKNMNCIIKELVNNNKNSIFENILIRSYFKIATFLIKKNYMAFRIYRKVFSIVLPGYLRKRKNNNAGIDDKTLKFIKTNWH